MERVRLPKRGKAKHVYFTDAAIKNAKPKKHQYLIWDAWAGDRKRGPEDPARGLCVLISPKGTKAYRYVFYKKVQDEKTKKQKVVPCYEHLGRVGEMSLKEARKLCNAKRAIATAGGDPTANNPAKTDSFETVFKDYIKHKQKGSEKNKSADATQNFVLNNCKGWHSRPIATIQSTEIEKLLWKIRDGDADKGLKPRPAAAIRIFAHLRSFFKWCSRAGGPFQISPMNQMDPPGTAVESERHYTNAEIKAIWNAADKLDKAEGSYVKLIYLLALRREELAKAKWSEFDNAAEPTLLTVPFERTKGKITRKRKSPYFVPLPPLAQRILKGLPRRDDGLVFPKLSISRIKDKLVANGAPPDFKLHTARHTIATWLEDEGKSEWERGLVLNHANSGITAKYSHGTPLALKRGLLEDWAAHVEGLIQPAGVAALR
jgi:integrase